MNLDDYVMLAGWPTPMAGSPATEDYHEAGNTDSGRRTVALVGWATPMVPNGGRTVEGTRTEEGREGKPQSGHLEAQAQLAGWASPAARDWKSGDASAETMDRNARPLNEQAVNFTPGPPPSPSPAGTGSGGECPQPPRGVLNFRFSLWLQGFPAAWGCCGASAMRSSRRRPRSSSGRSSTPSATSPGDNPVSENGG